MNAKRILTAFRADVRFQFRQGMYLVYAILTLIYILLLAKLPSWIGYWSAPLVVFSDPAVLGFIFIGGIIMLEKTQGVLQYINVTPVSPAEYIMAKILSLGLLGTVAGTLISTITVLTGPVGTINHETFHPLLLIISILPASAFFTLSGLLSTTGCRTMNRYFLQMIPGILLMTVPCLAVYPLGFNPLLSLLPPVAALQLILGAFHGIETSNIIGSMAVLLVWDIGFFMLTIHIFQKHIATEGASS